MFLHNAGHLKQSDGNDPAVDGANCRSPHSESVTACFSLILLLFFLTVPADEADG